MLLLVCHAGTVIWLVHVIISLMLRSLSVAALAGGCVAAFAQTRGVVVGLDSGSVPNAKRFGLTSGENMSFLAYSASFTGGVTVASGDVNGDGVPDMITGPASGALANIRAFSGVDGSLLTSFAAFAATFTGGARVAVGDVNGDGRADYVVGTGGGAPAEVKVFSGLDLSVIYDYIPFGAGYTTGITLAAGDVNGDGKADIIVGQETGGTGISVYSGLNLVQLTNFTALGGATTGVNVAAGDGKADILVGAGAGGNEVKLFSGANLSLRDFVPYASSNGVRVALGDVTGDGVFDIVTGNGPGGVANFRSFN